ncbi:MAG: VWA-like domain-containing protein [Nocardioides sp.]|uniref:vWA domain-containing protein n=1 Tax=Nocardioides sp. TaxID=35761 RepID=UPI0039E6E880
MDLTKLSAAKLWLISSPPPDASRRPDASGPRDLPYLATALYALIPIPSDAVPTMSIDERWRLYLNPGWYATVDISDVARELAHLVWHLLADHADRARSLNVDSHSAEHWHHAADATIAATLKPDRLTPTEMKDARALHLPPDRSAEEYYAILSKLPPNDGSSVGTLDPDDGCGSGADGIPRSHELPPEAEAGLDLTEAREIRRRVAIDYREHSAQRGDAPGEAWRWAGRILEPTIAWEPLLSQAVRRAVDWAAGRGDYTYSKPSRRASSVKGIVLPGMHRPVPRVAMVVDTSASVDDHLLARALGEVDGALKALGVAGGDVTVYSCDSAVHTVQRVRRARDTTLAGGGGTDLRVGMAAAQAQRPRPDVIVVFTDGETPWTPHAPPGCSVIVALVGRDRTSLPPTPPWAIRVECLLE